MGDWAVMKLQPYRQVTLIHHSYQNLSPRYFGPFKVIKRVGEVSYQLELPAQAKIHHTFHISQLRKCKGECGVPANFPISLSQHGHVILETEKIIDRWDFPRNNKPVAQVLVKRCNCSEDELLGGCQHFPMSDEIIFVTLILGKFNLEGLYEKIGFNKEIISRGRYAELTAAEQRPFRADEAELFARSAANAYKSFRDKAALSRAMTVDKMEEVAQGRVWTGGDAASRGLVDAIGGLSRAVAIAKQKANLPLDKEVTLVELSKPSTSLPEILGGLGSSIAETDQAIKDLLHFMSFSDGIQAHMDGIIVEQLNGSSHGNLILVLIRNLLNSL